MDPRDTRGERLPESVAANFLESYRVLARVAPHGAIQEADGLMTIATGIPDGYFNPAFITRPLVDPRALADRLRRFYARSGVPGLLIGIDASTTAPTAALARSAALIPGDPLPMLLLAPLPDLAPPSPPGLEIQVVENLTALRAHNKPMGTGALRAIFDDPAILRVPDVTLYVGILDGEPVAHALRVTSHRIAGIYNVGTLASHRRRGLGTAMTWRAALDGRAEGCRASALQSSPMAFSMYHRMGYRHIGDYQSWRI